jgi:hypothetical protein
VRIWVLRVRVRVRVALRLAVASIIEGSQLNHSAVIATENETELINFNDITDNFGRLKDRSSVQIIGNKMISLHKKKIVT